MNKQLTVFRPGTDELCSQQDSIEVINDFFAIVGEMVVQDLADISHKQLDDVNQTSKEQFDPMMDGKFLEIAKELHFSKSSGIDGLNSRLIIEAMKAMPSVFFKVVNESLSNGVFPVSCKTARITVISKMADLRNLNNLRPISLLSI